MKSNQCTCLKIFSICQDFSVNFKNKNVKKIIMMLLSFAIVITIFQFNDFCLLTVHFF